MIKAHNLRLFKGNRLIWEDGPTKVLQVRIYGKKATYLVLTEKGKEPVEVLESEIIELMKEGKIRRELA